MPWLTKYIHQNLQLRSHYNHNTYFVMYVPEHNVVTAINITKWQALQNRSWKQHLKYWPVDVDGTVQYATGKNQWTTEASLWLYDKLLKKNNVDVLAKLIEILKW